MKKIFFILAFLLFFYVTAFPAGFSTMEGCVTDKNNRPMTGAIVNVIGTARSATVNSNGRFRINEIPQGNFEIKINADGMEEFSQKINFAGADTQRLYIILRDDPNSEKKIAREEKTVEKKDEDSGKNTDMLTRIITIAAFIFGRK